MEYQDRVKESIGINMSVAMYMIGALKYFKGLQIFDIRAIAFEIAEVGLKGINPSDSSKYTLKTIPNKKFTGFQLLAYYYVSFAIAIPEMLSKLQLPYITEYNLAKKLFENK